MAQRAQLSVTPHLFRYADRDSYVTVSGQHLSDGDIVFVTQPNAQHGGNFVDFWRGMLEGNGVGTLTPGPNGPNPPLKSYVARLTYKGIGQPNGSGGVTVDAQKTFYRLQDDSQYVNQNPPAPPPVGGHPPGSEGGDITVLVQANGNPNDNGSGDQPGGTSDPNPYNDDLVF